MNSSSPTKFALVTGSTQGIGKQIALMLAKQGHSIGIHYRKSLSAAEKTAEEIRLCGVEVRLFSGDVSLPTDVARIANQFSEWSGGRLDCLVNNVGNYVEKPTTDPDFDSWREMLSSNLDSVFLMCTRFLPLLKAASPGARVVNLGFAGALNLHADTRCIAYAIAKRGVIEYSKALALELASQGITVNVVSPGVIETSVEKPIHEIPMSRLARVQELVRGVEFFVAPESQYITGQNLEVAGGWNL